MRITIIGAQGQLGKALQERLTGEIRAYGHDDVELTDADGVEAAIEKAAPDFVINAAAYNLVDRAEDDPEAAIAVNALGTRNLAIACAQRDAPLLQVSTDYVFSGLSDAGNLRSVPYTEEDAPQPLSAYAKSKLDGEYFATNIAPKHFVVRTCGLYGETKQPGTGNFVETMLRLSEERDELRIVNDQRCTPTSTEDLAAAIGSLIETDAYGLYHATNEGDATWYEFATEIFRIVDRRIIVHPITSAEFGAKAERPRYSVLDCSKLAQVIGYRLPPWQDALRRYVDSRNAP